MLAAAQMGLDQLSAAVKAISEKTKIAGLLVQKVEVGDVGDFDGCETVADVADELLEDVSAFRPVDEQDPRELAAMLNRHGEKVAEFLASMRARQIIGLPVVDNPAERRRQEIQSRRCLAPPQWRPKIAPQD